MRGRTGHCVVSQEADGWREQFPPLGWVVPWAWGSVVEVLLALPAAGATAATAPC